MTTIHLSPSEVNSFDYLIVGGGTAGCVVATRLAEYLPHKRVLLIEAGPSDFMNDKVLDLKQWLNLLGGELDYDYPTTEQPNARHPPASQPIPGGNESGRDRPTLQVSDIKHFKHRALMTLPSGNSHIRHSRAKVLGGCSSHNTLISFRPFEYDCARWQAQGCTGWSFATFTRVLNKLRNTIQPVHARHRNQLCKDWVKSCSTALDVPVIQDFNHEIISKGNLDQGVGFFSVAYNPDTGARSSASVAYVHPILRGAEQRPNLTILTDAWVSRVNVDSSSTVTGIDITTQAARKHTLRAKIETILCAGAVDTPRLLLHSGIGPSTQLTSLSIPVTHHIPGIGHNLLDHPETIIMWELNSPVPPNCTTMDSDAGLFLRSPSAPCADIMAHCYQIPFTLNTARLGYPSPINAFCMTPNIPRPQSRGQLYLTSADPAVKPALDFKYFTDPAGHDAAILVAGLRAARKVAQQAPFSTWLKREVAPGPACQTDEDLSAYARSVAHTVYHPAGTTKMGDLAKDPMACVGPDLRLRGLKRVRVADAGVFPEMTTINPMVTVLGIGERCAEMVAEEAGWSPAEVSGSFERAKL